MLVNALAIFYVAKNCPKWLIPSEKALQRIKDIEEGKRQGRTSYDIATPRTSWENSLKPQRNQFKATREKKKGPATEREPSSSVQRRPPIPDPNRVANRSDGNSSSAG